MITDGTGIIAYGYVLVGTEHGRVPAGHADLDDGGRCGAEETYADCGLDPRRE
jgi:hypothetical protein